jgi:RND superfamily putative drug exporter
VPLLLALTAVMGTIGIMGPLSHVIGGVDSSINEVILLIGLAVGVDYSMFYLRREREEREAGRSEEAALAAAAATSGRAVLVSGFPVMIAMAGMLPAGTLTFESFCNRDHPGRRRGLGRLADRAARDPVVARRSGREGRRSVHQEPGLECRREQCLGEDPQSGAAAPRHFSPARRWPARLPSAALPPPAHGERERRIASPGRRLDPDLQPDSGHLPRGRDPGGCRGQLGQRCDPAGATGHRADGSRSQGEPELRAPHHDRHLPDPNVTQVNIPIAGNGTDSKSNAALDELRDKIIPATIGSVPGVSADVTGFTASSKDFNDVTKSHLPLVFGFVLIAAFLLLLFTFRSIVIPIKAIILNLLSVGAAYGVIAISRTVTSSRSWGSTRPARSSPDAPVIRVLFVVDGLPSYPHPDHDPTTAACQPMRPSRTGSRRRRAW